jgi:hypothetical protein
MTPLPAPEVRVRGDATAEGTRVLTFNIASRRRAPRLQLVLPAGLPLQALSMAGERLDEASLKRMKENKTGGVLAYWGADEQGVDFELKLPAGTPVRLQVSDTRFDLDEAPGKPEQSRPPELAPIPYGFGLTDQVMVSATLDL